MRSLAITLTLAALSLVTGAAADADPPPINFDDLIFSFDVLNDTNCDFPRSDLLTSREITDMNVENFKDGPRCVFFRGADFADDAGAVWVKGLRQNCQVFFYTDEGCQNPPAVPPAGQCVFNGERFRAFAAACDGQLLQSTP